MTLPPWDTSDGRDTSLDPWARKLRREGERLGLDYSGMPGTEDRSDTREALAVIFVVGVILAFLLAGYMISACQVGP